MKQLYSIEENNQPNQQQNNLLITKYDRNEHTTYCTITEPQIINLGQAHIEHVHDVEVMSLNILEM